MCLRLEELEGQEGRLDEEGRVAHQEEVGVSKGAGVVDRPRRLG